MGDWRLTKPAERPNLHILILQRNHSLDVGALQPKSSDHEDAVDSIGPDRRQRRGADGEETSHLGSEAAEEVAGKTEGDD